MSQFKIPLPSGQPYIKANVTLGGVDYRLHLDWSYNGGYYRVTMLDGETNLPISGKGLHAGVDILETSRLGIGKLFIRGAEPTVENLGIDNELIYEPVSEAV